MGRCLFASCNNDARNRNKAFFRVPVLRNPTVAKHWLARARRADLKFQSLPKSAVVCIDHFHHSQLVSETYGTTTRLRVKDGEIPFPNGVAPTSSRQAVNIRREVIFLVETIFS